VVEDDVTLGELARRLEGFAVDVRSQFTSLRTDFASDVERVERSIAALDVVTRREYAADKNTAAAEREAPSSRVKSLEDTVRWLSRTVAGAVITGVVGVILFASRAGG
jgi:BMFP domain-containing protein YqiC